ncbi:unnamed protein product [Agarophyton chilense]
MTKKGAGKDRRAVSVLVDAIRTGGLEREDIEGAIQIIAQSLPDAARLANPALRLLARNSMRQACRMIPSVSHDGFMKMPAQLQATLSESLPSPELVLNSKDLLPSIRSNSQVASGQKNVKKRRMSTGLHRSFKVPSFPEGHSFEISRPIERLDDVGGISEILDTLRELVEWPLIHNDVYHHLGFVPPRGILLHGPPGCGKTLLAHALAGELGVSFLRVSGPEIVSGMSGESERKLRTLFSSAIQMEPSIIFIDEVDAIGLKKEGASKEMERRIVSQLLSCIDSLSMPIQDGLNSSPPRSSKEENADVVSMVEEPGSESNFYANQSSAQNKSMVSVVVIAATNRPESLEPALRRAGRFDREIELGAPDQNARLAILKKLCRNLRLGKTFNAEKIAKQTAGYVGADLHLLTKEAGLACMRRLAKTPNLVFLFEKDEKPNNISKHLNEIMDEDIIDKCSIHMCDFLAALKTIQPSSLREGFATRPNVSWADIGSLEDIREEMMMAIVQPIKRPELFSSLGLHAPAGVLLYGPPGCGKTLLAKAVASESGANFISVKGPELLSKYVGDSELAVRKVFARARSSAPCIIFFDELDALAPRRSGGGNSDSSGASERVVNMLLTEMDGFSDRKHVFLIAATNRPDIIDPAMLRPGRLDKLVFVPLPDMEGRVSILRTLIQGVKIDNSVDVESIARLPSSDGYSGADIQALIRSAGENALKEAMNEKMEKKNVSIQQKHFLEALKTVLPSVSHRDAEKYRKMSRRLRKTRGHIDSESILEGE